MAQVDVVLHSSNPQKHHHQPLASQLQRTGDQPRGDSNNSASQADDADAGHVHVHRPTATAWRMHNTSCDNRPTATSPCRVYGFPTSRFSTYSCRLENTQLLYMCTCMCNIIFGCHIIVKQHSTFQNFSMSECMILYA